MNESIRQKPLYYFAALLLGSCSLAIAQNPVASGHVDCSGAASDSAACTEPSVAFAMQIPAPMAGAQMGVVVSGEGFGLQEPAGQLVKDQPYRAQAVTQMKQTLADGSHIAQTTTATVARDSEGKTVRIQKLSQVGPWRSAADPEASGPTLTTIFDPVTNTHTDYTSDSKVAHVMTFPQGPPLPPPGATTISGSSFAVTTAGPGGPTANVMYSVQSHAMSPDPGVDKNSKTDQLGTKTIDGIDATGTRTTTTIPAGAIGNDKDIVITHETWYSAELKLVVLSTQDDPRFGETTYSLTNVDRSEPDASLFQVPAGYKVEKAPMLLKTVQ